MSKTERLALDREVQWWIDRGHSFQVATWVVYMSHNELRPAWLVEQRRCGR